MANLLPIQPFECEGEPTSVGVRWEKWLRSFEIYIDASNIEQPAKKRATLLHSAGSALQEIYYNLPGAHAESEDDAGNEVDVYKIAVEKLSEYFHPKQSKIYERHLFRLTKQEEGEKFEKFLVRLRNQASKCKFTNMEEHLVDQIVEKCTSVELRKKILSIGDSIKLEGIIYEANALEAVNKQLESFTDQKQKTMELNYLSRNINTKKCSRLRTCSKCGFKGHYKDYCYSKTRKRVNEDRSFGGTYKTGENNDNKKRQKAGHSSKGRRGPEKINNVESEELDYIFQIDDDSVIKCNLGGVPLDMLIDSGSKTNIIDDKTWCSLKKQNTRVYDQIKNPTKLLFAYGSSTPLKVLGSFKSNISVGNNNEIATFYVIQNGTRCLLGKNTSIALGVLKIGLGVNSVEEFPKFKGVVVDIPIDKSVPPVCQPYRRIPIPLESKVEEKIQELVESDIIEAVNGPAKWISPIVPILKKQWRGTHMCGHETGQ
nr:unnamed protein product [Callosobruchus analis]